MNITMNFQVLGILMVFGSIFIASRLAKLNSPIIDAIAWILGIVLFVVVIVAKVAPMFH